MRQDDGRLAALCIFTRETNPGPALTGEWLKLCTFKVAPETSGRKLGELLLKAAFGHCEANKIPATYVTAFPKQVALIGLFAQFGFQRVDTKSDGELVLAKTFAAPPASTLVDDPLGYNTLHYPHFLKGEEVRKFVVPVIPKWHNLLFPEWRPQQSFLPSTAAVSNAIRKAYLCNATTNRVRAGDLLFFYRSQDYKAVTTVAVVEDVLRSDDVDSIAAFVGKRTVYSVDQIRGLCTDSKVLALIFRQCRNAGHSVTYKQLKATGIVNNHIETITELKHDGALALLERAQL